MQAPEDSAFEAKLRSTFETFRKEDARLVQEVRLLLAGRREILFREFEEDGLGLARRLSDTVDILLDAYLEASPVGKGLTLVALGGYGRGELNPHSDVDVLVLYPDGAVDRARELTGPLLAFLWDVGHVVGHSARSVSECRAAMDCDLPSATAMLEGRLVAGSRALFRRFVEEVTEPWLAEHGEEFIEKKVEEAHARHEFYGGSPLLLTPNVKESAGGLRDMHVAGWIAFALSGRKDFQVYREAGLLAEDRAEELLGAYSVVHRVRNVLHTLAAGKQDALDLGVRREVAAGLGFTAGEGFSAVERFMRSYYRAALPLHRFLMRVIHFRAGGRVGAPRHTMRRGLAEVGGEVYPVDDTAVESPTDALSAIGLVVEQGLAPSPELTDAIGLAATRIDDAARCDSEVARRFLALLRMRGAGAGLRALDRAGFLAEYVPEFGRLSCLAREDPYHQFTVDEHTLRAVAGLDDLAAEDHPAREEYGRVSRPDLLRLGLLLHDVGKARGRDHVAGGASMVPEVTRRLGLDEEEARLVRFLVAEHLLMTGLVDRRAPHEAAAALAEAVPDRDRLRCLYLLTLADVMATRRGALTGWRHAQIRNLYESALAQLSPRPTAPFLERVIEEAGAERAEEARAHVEGMGPRYALEVEPSRAILHLDLAARLRERPAAVAFVTADSHGEVWVAARDARGLFARIAGVLTLSDLDIGAARAYTRADGVAVDGFFVTASGAAPPEDEELWKRVADDLCRAVAGDLDIEGSLARRRRRFEVGAPVPGGPPPGATASNRISDRHTVVEVTARDRAGLLFDLAHAITGRDLSIDHAMIATRGSVVLDTFYVTLPDGERPGEGALEPLLADLKGIVAESESA
ncbi:MAG: [protein-PII] uridylyltransferase family protein [Planctomycetota bacterium]|jgi:[protein-PII] uridylyltransferase